MCSVKQYQEISEGLRMCSAELLIPLGEHRL